MNIESKIIEFIEDKRIRSPFIEITPTYIRINIITDDSYLKSIVIHRNKFLIKLQGLTPEEIDQIGFDEVSKEEYDYTMILDHFSSLLDIAPENSWITMGLCDVRYFPDRETLEDSIKIDRRISRLKNF